MSEFSKKTTSTSLHSRLLLSAAAAALLFGPTAAQAGCTFVGTTIDCTAGAGTSGDDAVGTATLTPSLTMIVDTKASVTGDFNFGPGGLTPGAFALNVNQGAGDTTTLFGSVIAMSVGDPSLTKNTATVDNQGSINGMLSLGASGGQEFGGAIKITNEANAYIYGISTYGFAGNTLTNSAGGTIGTGDVRLDSGYLTATAVPTHAYDATAKQSTDTTGSSKVNAGGQATFINAGAVKSWSSLFGTDTTLENSGTMEDDVNLWSANAWARDENISTTTVFNDATNADVSDATYPGYDDFWQQTTTTTETSWGGNASITNSGGAAVYIKGDVNAQALGKISLDNEALITGNVTLDTTSSSSFGTQRISDYKDVTVNTYSNNGTVMTHTLADTITDVAVGGAITSKNVASGEIDGSFTANGAGGDTLDNAGLIKGGVQVLSNADDLSTVLAMSESFDTPVGVVFKTATVVDPAAPPNTTTTTNTWNEADFMDTAKTTTTTTKAVGGVASLTNEAKAVIGDSATPVTVTVDGDSGATLTNAGQIWGDAFVYAKPDSVTKVVGLTIHQVDAAHAGKDYARTQIIVVTDDTKHAPFTSSVSDKQTNHFADTETDTFSVETSYGAADAGLINSSAISGAAGVYASGASSLDNTGTIDGAVVVYSTYLDEATSVVKQDSLFSPGYTETLDKDYELTAAWSGADLLQTVLTTSNDDLVESFAFDLSSSKSTIGGTASLKNEADGVIGTKSTPVSVDVAGQDSASIDNAGTIWGNTSLAAFAGKQTTDISAAGKLETITFTSDETFWTNATLTEDIKQIKSSEVGDLSVSFEKVTAADPTKGIATFTNSGADSVHGNVDIQGVAEATLGNTGLITGNVSVSADFVNKDDAITLTGQLDNASVANWDQTIVVDKGVTTTTTDTDSDGSKALAFVLIKTSVAETVGGDALVTNAKGATIGEEATPVTVDITGDTTSGLDNAGTIYGSVDIESLSGKSADAAGVEFSKQTTDKTSGHVVNVNDGVFSYNSENDFTEDQTLELITAAADVNQNTVLGGDASFTNTADGLITGNVTLSGAGSATASNLGSIAGNLGVLSIEAATINSTVAASITKGASHDNSATTATLASNILTIDVAKDGWTDLTTDTITKTDTESTQVGGDAALNNGVGGTIGSSAVPSTISVLGVGSSSVVNDGTIYGTVYVGAAGSLPVNTAFTSSDELATTAHGTYDTLDESTYDTVKFVTTPVSYDHKTTVKATSDETIAKTFTIDTINGDASYTGAGNLYGSLQINSGGNTSLVNDNVIGATAGGGFVRVIAGGFGLDATYDEIIKSSHQNTDERVSTDYKTEVDTGSTTDLIKYDEIHGAFTFTPNGGDATLTNNKTIGGDSNNPIEVLVSAQGDAILTNKGHIGGNVDVNASAIEASGALDSIANDTRQYDYTITTDLVKLSSSEVSKATEVATLDLTGKLHVASAGGQAIATNSSMLTITGDLTVTGDSGASVGNTGSIWGNVDIESDPFGLLDIAATVSSTTTTTTTINGADITVETVGATTADIATTRSNTGGDASLNNSGVIGERVNDLDGHVSIFDANFDSNPDGNVYLNANGNVAVSNSVTGIVYGSIEGYAEGASTVSDLALVTDTHVVDATVSGKQTITTDTTGSTHQTGATTATGGTAVLTNSGKIGQRFADAVMAGTGYVTPAGDVYLFSNAGTTITNKSSGLIGGDVTAVTSATDSTIDNLATVVSHKFQDVATPANNLASVTTTTTKNQVDTVAGGSSLITNAGSMGVDVLDPYGDVRFTRAEIQAIGDAGAAINNSGTMQGDLILAASTPRDHVLASEDTLVQNYAGAKYEETGATETFASTETWTPVGGFATITNTGKMLQSDGLEVVATGYAGATVNNANKALIEGDVHATSWGTTETKTDAWTEVDGALGVLVSKTETNTDHTVDTGNKALVDNAGSILGNVESDGYVSGTVLNEATGSIGGDVWANSVDDDYWFTATTYIVGPTGAPDPANPDSFYETWTYVGGAAVVDNLGRIGGDAEADGFTSASVTNESKATIGGGIGAYSLFHNNQINDNGVVSLWVSGGKASVVNNGSVAEWFDVESFAGSSLTNAAAAVIDSDGSWGGYMETYSLSATSTFDNAGTIGYVPYGNLGLWFTGLTGLGQAVPNIDFVGNTAANNTGIINENLVFEDSDAGASASTFTFGKGSVLTGNITNQSSSLTVNFTDSGLYQGNMYGVSVTNKTGAGTWILTGNRLGVGEFSIAGGLVELGTPLSYFMANPSALIDYVVGSDFDPLQGLNPWAGNTAITPALQGQNVSSSLIYALTGAPIVTGNIAISSGAGLEGRAIILGNVTNNGSLLAGWMLPNTASLPLGNLLDNTNRVLPSVIEVSGDLSQGASGTLVTNIAPTVNRPERQLVGVQAELFAPTSYWLSVAPFAPDTTNAASYVVDGKSTIAGRVMVYVNKGGLYVNGTTTDVLTSTGPLTVTATTAQSAPSLFVGFGLTTRTAGGKNIMSVAVNRTSYATVAATPNQAHIGTALDSAVPDVASAIAANNFGSVAEFTNAQDLAGFLADMDWQVGSGAQASAILNNLSPDGYATLSAMDTGVGFRAQIMRHLTGLPGGAIPDPLSGAWIQGYGVSQDFHGNHGAAEFNGTTVGTALGWDFTLDNVIVGIAGGYARTTFGTPQKAFNGSINSYQAGAYGHGVWLDHLYVDATLWANFGHGHVLRVLNVGDRIASASVKPSEFRADLEGGWRFTWGTLGLTPHIGFSFRDAALDDITEAGAGGLGYRLTDIGDTMFTPTLGIRLDDTWSATSFVTVQPLVGIGVEFQPKSGDVTAQFNGGGDPFVVNGAARSSVAFKPEAGLNILIGQHVSMQLGYMGAIGNERSMQGGWLGLRGNW